MTRFLPALLVGLLLFAAIHVPVHYAAQWVFRSLVAWSTAEPERWERVVRVSRESGTTYTEVGPDGVVTDWYWSGGVLDPQEVRELACFGPRGDSYRPGPWCQQ